MCVLRAEGCFRHPSAMLQIVLSRTKNHLAENDLTFGAERFFVPSHERKLKDDPFILHSVTSYIIILYYIT